MNIKSLTIYCSSSNNLNLKYYRLAEKIGFFLGSKKITIIYGGGKTGLMGKVSISAFNQGSKVIGIIPKFLKKTENVNYNISKTIIVKTMAERKKILFEKGDAFLILPGGSGTIEEATEIISWKYLGLHKKPIIIFNYQNYWKYLFDMYNNTKKLKFGNKNLQDISINVKKISEFKKLFNEKN
tara:strand:- start:1220 stop:1768 length:549 start_codon:yes stop_codon:yes gene_type:complete